MTTYFKPIGKYQHSVRVCIFLLSLIPCITFANIQEDETILLNFENANLHTLISVISKETQRNFLLDPRVRKQKITLIAEKPVNKKDAYGVFLSILRIHGYGVVESGEISKIIPLNEIKQNKTPFKSAKKDFTTDDLVTEIITLENAKAEQMAGIIRPMIPSFGQVIAYGNSNSLIVLAPVGALEKIKTIIQTLEDKIKKTIEIIPLKHSIASDVIAIITKLEAKSLAKTNRLLMVEDKRSNQIIVSGGSTKDKKRVIRYIKQLDIAKKNTGNTQVIYLNYAKAKDLADLLKQASGVASKKNTEKVIINADENTNSLVIYAPAEKMQEIKTIIKRLDIRKAQVLVQAIIVEISDNNAAQLGVRWGINTSSAVGLIDFTGAGNLVNLLAGNAGRPNPAALGAGTSVALGDFSEDGRGWGALIKALKSDSGVNILSNPSVITLDNEEASIEVGQEVPFITGQSTQNSGNPFTTIQRKTVGLKLKVTPRINQGDAMQLKIEQEVSSLQTSARNATGASDIITANRSINTTVIINDNQILVLGGLTTQQTEESAERITGLSDIPLIGNLFQSRQNQSEKRTLMVFIKTEIIRDFSSSQAISQERYTSLYKDTKQRKKLELIDKNNKLNLIPTHQMFDTSFKEKSKAQENNVSKNTKTTQANTDNNKIVDSVETAKEKPNKQPSINSIFKGFIIKQDNETFNFDDNNDNDY